MGKTDNIFESIIAEDEEEPSLAPDARGNPDVERQHVVDSHERRYQAFSKLEQDYLIRANRVARKAYRHARAIHPAFKKMLRVATQAMWDEKLFKKIMSESTAIIESIMEDDNVIGGANRFRKGIPASDPKQGRLEDLEELRNSQLKMVRADIWSLTNAMKLIKEHRHGEALVHLYDMLEIKRKDLVKFQPKD